MTARTARDAMAGPSKLTVPEDRKIANSGIEEKIC